MPFSELQASDVEAHLGEGELTEYRQHVSGIEDPLPTIIADVTSLVRGYVGVRFRLTEAGVPDELRAPAIDLVIHRLAKRIRKGGDDDGDRAKAAERALQVLRDTAEGRFAIADELSTSASDTRSGGWGSQPRFDSPAAQVNG